MTPEEIDSLDPGIRQTVLWLRDNNFDTTDSGDGITKVEQIQDLEAIDRPHVFMVVEHKEKITEEAHRLFELVRNRGLEEVAHVEASYSPQDGVAILALYDVNDELLKGEADG